jgi:ABC-2 type transport system ATP-binding protein
VLATQAPLLILDEPTNTLDPTMRDELLRQLRHARDQGHAVLFSSHVLSEVEQVCDRVGILQNGRLVHLQTLAELRQGKRVRARFANGHAGDIPVFPGLVVRERTSEQITFEHTGPLPPLLEWLSRQPLADLHVEPLGLSRIYAMYHGEEA